ncbi:MAG TPA: DUF1328 family protein [Chitinispirillaceae bacterium]|nr:DUF1328 family protein [Chitinispirillaceae bacterium]
MLYWILVFAVLAIIAAVMGFGGLASTFAGIAQVLFFIFLGIIIIMFAISIGIFNKLKRKF